MISLEDKIRFTRAKIRNIIYYRLEIEPTIESRYRCQYMGILRATRKQVKALVSEMEDSDSRKKWFLEVLKIINPKVKSNECYYTIVELKVFYEQSEEKGTQKA